MDPKILYTVTYYYVDPSHGSEGEQTEHTEDREKVERLIGRLTLDPYVYNIDVRKEERVVYLEMPYPDLD